MSNFTSPSPSEIEVVESDLMFRRVSRASKYDFTSNLAMMLVNDMMNVTNSEASVRQTDRMAPILVNKTLQDNHGTAVKMWTGHPLVKMPVMGDRKAKGREEGLKRSPFEAAIRYYRKPVYEGSTWAQQQVGVPLTREAQLEMEEYFVKLFHCELPLYHLMGMRGTYKTAEMIIPAEEPVFLNGQPIDEHAETFSNPLVAPSFGRHSYAGNATSVDTLQTTDKMDEATVRRVLSSLVTQDNPVGNIKLRNEDTTKAGVQPYKLWLMPEQMFEDLREDLGPAYRELEAAAMKRVSGYGHPAFMNDCVFIKGCFIVPINKPVQATEGTRVKVALNDLYATEVEQVVPAGVTMQRSVILGGRALMMLYGGSTKGLMFSRVDEKDDYDDKDTACLAWMGGFAIARHWTADGRLYDVGRHIVDAAVERED